VQHVAGVERFHDQERSGREGDRRADRDDEAHGAVMDHQAESFGQLAPPARASRSRHWRGARPERERRDDGGADQVAGRIGDEGGREARQGQCGAGRERSGDLAGGGGGAQQGVGVGSTRYARSISTQSEELTAGAAAPWTAWRLSAVTDQQAPGPGDAEGLTVKVADIASPSRRGQHGAATT
jgi:hypothetical protein